MSSRFKILVPSFLALVAPLVGAVSCTHEAQRPARTRPAPPAAIEALALPGAVAPAALDFIFFDAPRGRVWVPAAGSGSVDVFDIAAKKFSRIEGFPTAEREGKGRTRTVGPSSGAVGDGFVYVGNRANKQVCAVDEQTLEKADCLELREAPDCVEYVASTRELWVTTPASDTLEIVQTSGGKLGPVSEVTVPGEPEGNAVDEQHQRFLTNLEDKGSTLSFDVKSRSLKDTWEPGCGTDGPRGVAIDSARALVMVACTDHIQVLDAAHGGTRLGTLATGAGVDNIDYVASTGLLYIAAGKAARLTIAKLNANGELAVVTTRETAPGARNAVADASGNVYIADPQRAGILLVAAPR